jgi:hypothetical protein
MQVSIIKLYPLASLLVLGALLFGCGGSTTTGGEEDFSGSQFVSTDESTGSFELEVLDETIQVGQTGGFFARIKGESGQPVESRRVICDTESGLALVEPTTGSFLTNSQGESSGRLGCENPGSFMLACFLGNKRAFSQIKCVGDLPEGFEGFEGAGGGTLGGGVVDPDNGGPGLGENPAPDRLRIGNIQVIPITGEPDTVPEVDLRADLCNNDTPADPKDDFVEPFGDDEVQITAVNNTPYFIRYTSFSYVVERGMTGGRDFQSPKIALNGASDPTTEGGRTVVLASKMFTSVNGRKAYADGQLIPLGGNENGDDLKNVKVTIFGTTSTGLEVQTSASFVVSFDNFNYCSATR